MSATKELTTDEAKIAAAVKAAVKAIRGVLGQGSNAQWSGTAITLLTHVMHQVLKGSGPHYEQNRGAFETALLKLWEEVKDPGTKQ